jgi:hypothetical protein
MNRDEKYINNLVKNIIEESIEQKANKIVSKLKTEDIETKSTNKKETLTMTENEIINFIKKIVNEQKNSIGFETYKKNHKKSGMEGDDYIKSVTKKMKDYLKNGSKGDFDTNPKIFPKGNGELAKMDKKGYVASPIVDEYIENFAQSPGMENLDYDEIKPNEEWIDMNIEGSSKTGNSGEYANAVDTGLGKKINTKRKKNYYAKEKKKSYNKSPQPIIDVAGENQNKDNKKIDKIFNTLESVSDKRKSKIDEDLIKMKSLIGYNQKTQ